jgi:hypothetical protein
MNCAFLDHLAAKMHLRFIAGKKALFHEKKIGRKLQFFLYEVFVGCKQGKRFLRRWVGRV